MDWTIVQFERDFLERKSSPRRPRAPTSSSTTFPSSRCHFSTLLPLQTISKISPTRFLFAFLFFLFFRATKNFQIFVTFVNRSSADNAFFSAAHSPPEMPLIPVTRVLHRVCAQFWWDKRRVNTRRRRRQRQRSARTAETRLHSSPSTPLQAEKPWIDTTRSHTCAPLSLSLALSLYPSSGL